MTFIRTLLKTSVDTGRQLLARPLSGVTDAAPAQGVMVPICSLGPEQRPRILQHLLALSPSDRYLRFGYAANDEQVQAYVDGLNFERDEIFGIFNSRLEIVAMAHLALHLKEGAQACAEFGVSVQHRSRGRGYGARLFERAAMHARNERVLLLFIHALSENTPMIRIARRFGATLEREGSETEAYVRLPHADLDSQLTELISEQYAQTNYTIKEQVRRFVTFLADVQEVRQGVREGRHKSAE
jgi:GNAT superfamily N-acetyltransferase